MAHGHGHLHHRAGPASKQEPTFHVQRPWIYVRTLICLLILMTATIVFAEIHFADFTILGLTLHGTMINNMVAMAIAVAKALLVLSFFMGVIYGTKLTKMWAAAGFIGFVLLFLALGDYSTRMYEPTPKWTPDPGSALRRSIPESRSETQFKPYERTSRF